MPTLAPSPRPETISADTAITLLDQEIRRIAALTELLPAAAPVPGCPGWTAADLIKHIATLFPWVERMVAGLSAERPKRYDAVLPEDWSAVPDWFGKLGGSLVATLRDADPDAPMYAWAADRTVRFWIRRMLSEAAIHRLDLEDALGESPALPAELAAAVVDEFLEILPFAAYFRPNVTDLYGDGETIHLHATDAPDNAPAEWLITLEPEGFRWTHQHVKGAVAVRGTATDLARFVYGRRRAQELTVIGDDGLLAHWVAKSAF